MRQSRFVWLGVLELAILGALFAAFGPAVVRHEPVVLLFALSGVLTVAAVSLESRTVTWRHLVGAAHLAFALTWPLMYVPDALAAGATTADLAMLAVAAVNAVVFAFFGVDVARDGPHYAVTGDVDRVLVL